MASLTFMLVTDYYQVLLLSNGLKRGSGAYRFYFNDYYFAINRDQALRRRVRTFCDRFITVYTVCGLVYLRVVLTCSSSAHTVKGIT